MKSWITCVHCDAILSTNYESDRGREETALYTHKCETVIDDKLMTKAKGEGS